MHDVYSIEYTNVCSYLENEKQATTMNCLLFFTYISFGLPHKTTCPLNYLHVKNIYLRVSKFFFTCK